MVRSCISNTFNNSKKLAAARNFLAVDLLYSRVSSGMLNEGVNTLRDASDPILVIGNLEDFQRKGFNVRATNGITGDCLA